MSVSLEEINGILIATPQEYFDDEVSRILQGQLKPLIQGGRNRLVLDLEKCPLVSSPGVACLLDLSIRLREDCNGCMVLCGMTPLMFDVFTMVGVIPTAETATNRSEAISIATNFVPDAAG